MTAIASLKFKNCPVLFGDLLIAGASEAAPHAALPTLGDVHDFFGESGWNITGMQQKIVLISDKCMLAWAGSWLGARIAIAELKSEAAAVELSADGVRARLAALEDLRRHPTSFVGWVNEAGRFKQFRHGAQSIATDSWGRMEIAGSGATVFSELSAFLEPGQFSREGQPLADEEVSALCMTWLGLLLGSELHGGSLAPTVMNMYGGGYEIATYIEGRFQKVGGFTLVVWDAKVIGTEVLLEPRFALHQKYVGNVLLLRSSRFAIADGLRKSVDDQRHAVLPMFELAEPFSKQELYKLRFDSRLHCHIFSVHGMAKTDVVCKVQQDNLLAEPTMSTREEEGNLFFDLHPEFINPLIQHFRDMVAEH